VEVEYFLHEGVMKKVVGLGAGGHCKVLIEVLCLLGGYEIIGLTDIREELAGQKIRDIVILGGDQVLADLKENGIHHAFIGLGSTGDAKPRKRLFDLVQNLNFQLVRAIHPQATVSPSAKIGAGPTILAGAVVNAEARIGTNAIINTGAVVEHDCVIGDHVHVATGARLASGVRVDSMAHIGAGATVRQGIVIGEGAVVAIGAAVVADVVPWTVVGGVPAHPIGTTTEIIPPRTWH